MKKQTHFPVLLSALFTFSLLAACSPAPAANTPQPQGNAAPETAAPNAQEGMAQEVPPPTLTDSSLSSPQNTISVNSTEEVSIAPDIAQIVYAVQTEKPDASSCQKQNTEDVNKVIELLKSLGVEEASIQTSDYYMHPIYSYSNNTQRLTGYEATTSLTVSDLPIDNLGNILSQSVEAGINNIQSITYQSSKYDEGYAEALKLAVESARAKAETLALAGGCMLGNVANIYENSNYSEARYTDNALASQLRAEKTMNAMEDSSVSIMPGEIDVEVNITVEYYIQSNTP